MKNNFRPPAVPLITIDPYFSVWSFADQLHDDFTRHWTGRRNAMTGMITIDGVCLLFAGKIEQNAEDYFLEPKRMKQISLTVMPLTTRYVFEGCGVQLTLDFTSSLLLSDFDLLSRPVSYVTFSVVAIDEKPHQVQVYFDITGEWCVNTTDQEVVWGERKVSDTISTLFMGTESQKILERSGDNVRIDWGYVHLVTSNSDRVKTTIANQNIRKEWIKPKNNRKILFEKSSVSVREAQPVLCVTTTLGDVGKEAVSWFIGIAYDDIFSVEYFHDKRVAYWRREGLSFDEMLIQAFSDYDQIMQKCHAFDKELIQEAESSGGSKYADLLSLAYRQSIAAHKLVCDSDGKILFLSKECFSNGCMATVDVSYPSIPLFLLYAPELVKGMLRPIFKYAAMDEWTFDFAPHDVGRYPNANGQVYGNNQIEFQMPVEECGNMLIATAAVCLSDNNSQFAVENWSLLECWGEYLSNNGFDPENQLCTDDFAGHLAHNSNLSIKSIMGVASYAILCKMVGKSDEARIQMSKAKVMAERWQGKAIDINAGQQNDALRKTESLNESEGTHYKLAFDQQDSWSLKYNLIWDQLFETDIFPVEISKSELAYYAGKQRKYGVPLDSRNTYTKADWLVWIAAMADSSAEFEQFIKPLWDFANESLSRVPFSDWYDTITGYQNGFQHRSVLGGIFIKLLKDKRICKFKDHLIDDTKDCIKP